MLRRIGALATGALLAATMTGTAVGLPAAPAGADVWVDTDPNEGQFAGDVKKVRLVHTAKRVKVFIDWHVNESGAAEPYDYALAYLDTVKGDNAPEFVMALSYRGGDDYRKWIYRQDDFTTLRAQPGKCPAMRAEILDGGTLLMSAPRRCLRTNGKMPPAVRVAVASYDDAYTTFDWAPRTKEGFTRDWTPVG